MNTASLIANEWPVLVPRNGGVGSTAGEDNSRPTAVLRRIGENGRYGASTFSRSYGLPRSSGRRAKSLMPGQGEMVSFGVTLVGFQPARLHGFWCGGSRRRQDRLTLQAIAPHLLVLE